MKTVTRTLTVGVIGSILLSVVATLPAQAQSVLTDGQREVINANCLTIKNSLGQLHASDALLRVNRGQLYELMKTRLMDRFNGRVTSNNLDTIGLLAVTNSYNTALTTFRQNYQAYERQLSAAMRIDCTKEPDAFHNAILDARTKRGTVHDDVTRLHRLIDDYRSAVNDFYLNYSRVNGGSQ